MRLIPEQKIIVVCGPTASGKSCLADTIAVGIQEASGAYLPVVVVDSMQVYREIPTITNQARSRPAELVSVTSVTDEWTVARHRQMAQEIIDQARSPVVLDAGTGMYLNSIMLDIPLAPKVAPELREQARSIAATEINPRRASRRLELALAGEEHRGSIWDGDLLYDTTLLYLCPEREDLDERIRHRSANIAENGLDEARLLVDLMGRGVPPNPSARDSIGVRELIGCVLGEVSLPQAQKQIETRTRALARRQMRWFDKLARTLEGRAEILISPDDQYLLQKFHNMVGSWTE